MLETLCITIIVFIYGKSKRIGNTEIELFFSIKYINMKFEIPSCKATNEVKTDIYMPLNKFQSNSHSTVKISRGEMTSQKVT